MITRHNPATIAPPASAYVQGYEVADATRWLHVSGQVGARPDGTTPAGTEAQMEECWTRIFAVLESAGMRPANIVKVSAFLTDPGDVGLYREVRDRRLDGHEAASTLLVVSALAHPDWTVEIEAVAAA